jgi:hypothetical protein
MKAVTGDGEWPLPDARRTISRGGPSGRRGIADDQGDLPAKKVRYQKRQLSLIVGRAVFDRDVLALDEACFLQAVLERGHAVRHVSERSTAEKPIPLEIRCR